jgi:GTP-binding protein
VNAPEAWGQFTVSSVAQRGLEALLEGLWQHATRASGGGGAGAEEEAEPWHP